MTKPTAPPPPSVAAPPCPPTPAPPHVTFLGSHFSFDLLLTPGEVPFSSTVLENLKAEITQNVAGVVELRTEWVESVPAGTILLTCSFSLPDFRRVEGQKVASVVALVLQLVSHQLLDHTPRSTQSSSGAVHSAPPEGFRSGPFVPP